MTTTKAGKDDGVMTAPMTIAEHQAVIDQSEATISHANSTIVQCREDVETARNSIIRLLKHLPPPNLQAFGGEWTCSCPQCSWSKIANIREGHIELELAYANHYSDRHL
jgi:hypothetical protein